MDHTNDRIKLNKKQTKEKFRRFKFIYNMKDPGEQKFQKVIHRVLSFIPTFDVSILDIGCRGGLFFDALKEWGFHNFYGTEILQEWVDMALQKGYNACISDIQEEHLDKKFDVIFMAHVLEHTSDPYRAIQNVSIMLQKGGIFYVEVPRREEGKDNDFSHFYQFNCFDKLNECFDPDIWKLLWKQDDYPIIGMYERR